MANWLRSHFCFDYLAHRWHSLSVPMLNFELCHICFFPFQYYLPYYSLFCPIHHNIFYGRINRKWVDAYSTAQSFKVDFQQIRCMVLIIHRKPKNLWNTTNASKEQLNRRSMRYNTNSTAWKCLHCNRMKANVSNLKISVSVSENDKFREIL